MNPEIIKYSIPSMSNRYSYLAIMKNGYVVDIACSNKQWPMFSEKDQVLKNTYVSLEWTKAKVRAQDLALYTHWP